MFVMGLDTSLQRCSVAILSDGNIVGIKKEDMERGHAERLAPMVADLLNETALKISDFDRVCVVVGPGGFTGVRIALAFARGLGIGTKAAIVGISSLAALAAGATNAAGAATIAPIIDARRGQVYAGLYTTSGDVIVHPFVSEPQLALNSLADALGGRNCLAIGTGASLLADLPETWSRSNEFDQIDPVAVAQLGVKSDVSKSPPIPLYLRAPDAKPPKPSILR